MIAFIASTMVAAGLGSHLEDPLAVLRARARLALVQLPTPTPHGEQQREAAETVGRLLADGGGT